MAMLTLKNIPDEVLEELRRQAIQHRRSLTQEAICQLADQRALPPDPFQILRDIQEFADRLKRRGLRLRAEDVDRWIEEGQR